MERQLRRRRRPALSCLECRRRKIKCDRNNPCNRCVAAKARCSFEGDAIAPVVQQLAGSIPSPALTQAQAQARAPIQVQRAGSERVAENGSSQRPEPPVAAAASAASEQIGTPIALGRGAFQQPNRTQDAEPDLADLLQRVQKLEGSAAASPISELSETGRHILARQSGLQDSHIILNKTRVLTWSDWMGTAKEFSLIGDCYEATCGLSKPASFQGAEIGALVAQIRDLLQKCKQIARATKLGRPSRCLPAPEFDLSPPSRAVSDSLARLYFQSFESTSRILHIPTFWKEYQKYWDSPGNVPISLRLKVLLVVAIGSMLQSQRDADAVFRKMVHQWVFAAQSWLSGPLEKDRLDVNGIQVHCLTILARHIYSIGGDMVWTSMGSLIHRAMQIGLHRDPKYLPPMAPLQAEIRRRLWVTIVEMAVQASLDSAMPPRISLDEFDTEAPSNINDDEIDEWTVALQPHPRGTYTSASLQLILLDSLPARLRILRLLNGLRSELSYMDVLAMSSEITEACRVYGNFFKVNADSELKPFHRNMLDQLVRRFMIPLHCPFASKARTNPLFYYSLKVSLDTAMGMIRFEPDEAFSNLMVVGGGLFKEGMRCAAVVVTQELLAQTEAQKLEGTLQRNSHQRDLLKQLVKDMISSSLDRIQQGESNIKAHMFLSMILAQVEAIETGSSCEMKIAQSAKESLEVCHDLLRARVDVESLDFPSDTGFVSTDLDEPPDGAGLDFDLDFDFFFPEAGFSYK